MKGKKTCFEVKKVFFLIFFDYFAKIPAKYFVTMNLCLSLWGKSIFCGPLFSYFTPMSSHFLTSLV